LKGALRCNAKEQEEMARTIIVKVVDKNGYGLSGYKVKAYGGNVVVTDRTGKASIEADGSTVSIYVHGSEEYSGSTSNCDNPLVVTR
jgi:hypothetical protein